jgi:hypothetical protein
MKTIESAQAHLDDVAKTLTELDADIVHLSEIQDCKALQVLMDKMGDESYRPYVLKGTDTATGQNVGFLTRIDPQTDLYRTNDRLKFPLPYSSCGSTISSTSGVSKHYFTKISVPLPNGESIVINLNGNHLVAFPNLPDRCAKREAQSTVLSNELNKVVQWGTEEVIVLGDFNDFDEELKSPSGEEPLSRVIRNIML